MVTSIRPVPLICLIPYIAAALLESAAVKISMDGRGRVFDNIFIERLWRTVKYEDIYLRNYAIVMELEQGLERYFPFYNNEQFHQSLD